MNGKTNMMTGAATFTPSLSSAWAGLPQLAAAKRERGFFAKLFGR